MPESIRTPEPTDCPHCGQSAEECNDSAARGWDNCCMRCDEIGRRHNHRAVTIGNLADATPDV